MEYFISQLPTGLDGTYLIAQLVHSSPVGVLRLETDESAGWINSCFVEETHRGNGVGTLLLRQAFEVCKQLGFETVGLTVKQTNEKAIKLYKRLGFKTYLDGHKDYKQMIKVL